MTEGLPTFDPDAMSYEDLVTALEGLTERMASGSIGIEEAAQLYELAGSLHTAALARLEAVQERINRMRNAADPKDQEDQEAG